MHKTNWRLVVVGLVMIVFGCGFFVAMGSMATQSDDPVALMQTVGTLSGGVGALGTVTAIFGFAGRRRQGPA